jgi:hypothetical protein
MDRKPRRFRRCAVNAQLSIAAVRAGKQALLHAHRVFDRGERRRCQGERENRQAERLRQSARTVQMLQSTSHSTAFFHKDLRRPIGTPRWCRSEARQLFPRVPSTSLGEMNPCPWCVGELCGRTELVLLAILIESRHPQPEGGRRIRLSFRAVMTRTQMSHFGFGTDGLQEYINIPSSSNLLRVRRIWAQGGRVNVGRQEGRDSL